MKRLPEFLVPVADTMPSLKSRLLIICASNVMFKSVHIRQRLGKMVVVTDWSLLVFHKL